MKESKHLAGIGSQVFYGPCVYFSINISCMLCAYHKMCKSQSNCTYWHTTLTISAMEKYGKSIMSNILVCGS